MANSPAKNSDGPIRVTLQSDGNNIADSVQVISVTVNRSLNKIPVAKIVMIDGDMPDQDFPVSNSDDFKPGKEITIKAGYGQSEETIFKGIIVKHGIKISGDNSSRLIIECRDKAVKLTIGRKNANYVDSKDSDIISKIVSDAGLSSDVSSTNTQHKELVQYYCSDWDFILSRSEANGYVVDVDDGKLTVKSPDTDGSPVLTVKYGLDLFEFHADLDSLSQLASVKAVAWDVKNQSAIEGQATTKQFNKQGDLDSSTLAKVVGLDKYTMQTAIPNEQSELLDWAKAQQIKSGLARIRGQAKFQGSDKAVPGKIIELAGVGNHFNGNAYISAVQHKIQDGNWVTEVEFGMSPGWFAERRDLVSPPASGLLPGIEGLQIGLVMKLDQDPDGQYKVQVSVPIMQAQTEGVWARLSRFYASGEIGAFFVPEVGDEVVLGYLNNDPSHPIILGSLYSSKNKPPYDITADNYTKALVTKSKLKLEFDDEKKIITVTTPGNNQIVISDDGKSILLQDQNNNKLQLDENGISLESPKDIKLTAKGQVSIDAVGEIGVTSKADVKVSGMNVNHEAKVAFVGKGSASAELSASGQTTVKGAMVMIN